MRRILLFALLGLYAGVSESPPNPYVQGLSADLRAEEAQTRMAVEAKVTEGRRELVDC